MGKSRIAFYLSESEFDRMTAVANEQGVLVARLCRYMLLDFLDEAGDSIPTIKRRPLKNQRTAHRINLTLNASILSALKTIIEAQPSASGPYGFHAGDMGGTGTALRSVILDALDQWELENPPTPENSLASSSFSSLVYPSPNLKLSRKQGEMMGRELSDKGRAIRAAVTDSPALGNTELAKKLTGEGTYGEVKPNDVAAARTALKKLTASTKEEDAADADNATHQPLGGKRLTEAEGVAVIGRTLPPSETMAPPTMARPMPQEAPTLYRGPVAPIARPDDTLTPWEAEEAYAQRLRQGAAFLKFAGGYSQALALLKLVEELRG